jgi:hypothetical protein
MFSAAIVLIAMSVSSVTGAQAPAGVSAKPQQSIVDTSSGGGASFDFIHQCGLTSNGSAHCWGHWGA